MKQTLRTCVAVLVFAGAFAALVPSALAALPQFTGIDGIEGMNLAGSAGVVEFNTPELTGFEDGISSGTFAGSPSTSSLSNVSLEFFDGRATYGCFTEYLKPGETGNVVLKALDGHLGYINKGTKSVGIMFEVETGPIAECKQTLFGPKLYVGDLLAKITPVNTYTTEFHLTFNAAGTNHQEPAWLEGEGEHKSYGKQVSFRFVKTWECKVLKAIKNEVCSETEPTRVGVEGEFILKTEQPVKLEA